VRRRARRSSDDESERVAARAGQKAPELPKDFVLKATPWVDLSLTSFWMDERSDNFFNLGVQVGGYFVERLRLSARLIAPLDDAGDSYSSYEDSFGFGGAAQYQNVDARSISVLYGASLGLTQHVGRGLCPGGRE